MADDGQPLDLRSAPADIGDVSRCIFLGSPRCLLSFSRFDSNPERLLAIILERETEKWFKPALLHVHILYRSAAEDRRYQPDFLAETSDRLLMLEVKAANRLADPEVIAKRNAAVAWCRSASAHTATRGGKPWLHVLIPHDAIAENMTLDGLIQLYRCGDA